MREQYRLRRATSEDAEALGTLHVRIWRETYAGLMPDEALAALDVRERTALWQALLSSPKGPSTWVALEPGSEAIIGWLTIGEARDADAPARRELMVLNVVAEHQGRGAARQLMAEGLGDDDAYLWVVEGNDRAVAFYRKYGFALDGAQRDEDEGNRDLRMVRVRGSAEVGSTGDTSKPDE